MSKIDMIVGDTGFYEITNRTDHVALIGPPLGIGPLPPALQPGETWISNVRPGDTFSDHAAVEQKSR